MRQTSGTILIVDDDPAIRTSMSLCLHEIGYSVRTAEDGIEALMLMGDEVPQILLTDLNMPRMSGFELLALVHNKFPTVQTIAMSGAFCGDDLPAGVLADAFFQKGSSIRALFKVVEDLPSHSLQNVKSTPFWIRQDNQDRMDSSLSRSS